jgi:hypothetical protein
MTNRTDETLSLRWVASASGVWPGRALALAIERDEAGLDGHAADTLQRYLAFMSGMTVLHGEAARGPGAAPALRVTRGACVDALVGRARQAAAEGHAALVCIAARGDGETDLCDVLDALRDAPLRTFWLYDARDGEGDVAWTQALHRRCGRSLDGVAAPGGFEAALRACSHFIHGTREAA